MERCVRARECRELRYYWLSSVAVKGMVAGVVEVVGGGGGGLSGGGGGDSERISICQNVLLIFAKLLRPKCSLRI